MTSTLTMSDRTVENYENPPMDEDEFPTEDGSAFRDAEKRANE